MRRPAVPSDVHLISLQSVGSTNVEAQALARQGAEKAPEGTIVWSLEQTAGRGRRGNQWSSPLGNLYCSWILRPDVSPAQAAELSFVAALAINDVVMQSCPGDVSVKCKWPNDILVNQKKISGILLESSGASSGKIDWLIIGAGINVTRFPEGLNESSRGNALDATSLCSEGSQLSVSEVLELYIEKFLNWKLKWTEQGFAVIRKEWLARAVGLGLPVRVRLVDQELFGTFIDLDRDGALILEQDGRQRRVTSGEVFL